MMPSCARTQNAFVIPNGSRSIDHTEEEIGSWTQCYFWNLNLGTLLHCVHNALLSIATEQISLRRGNTVHGNELAINPFITAGNVYLPYPRYCQYFALLTVLI